MHALRQLLLIGGLVVLMLNGGTAVAATYHVDPAGDDAAAGTAASPWATIQHAASAMLPGDTVIVHPGIYRETVFIAVSGTAESPITFQGLAGAILESPDPTASFSAFDVTLGVGNVVIDGFEARGGFHETIFVRAGAHDITVRNCNLHDNRLGIWVDSAANVEISGCQVHHNTALGVRISGSSRFVTVRDTSSSNNDDGAGCSGGADGFSVEETTAQLSFLDSQATDNGQDGFDLQGNAVLVARSESRNNRCSGIKLGQSARVENSRITGNTTGIATTSFYNDATSIAIFNSTIADNSGTQMLFKDPNANGAAPVTYNVLVRNVIASGPGKALEVAAGVALVEDHNILFREDTTSRLIVRHLAGGGEQRYSGQAINAGLWATDSGQGVGSFAIEPDFVGSGDYHLTSESVAIDSGDPTDASPDSINGVPRPQGSRIDIGPDEALDEVINHRPWADPGPDRATLAGARVNFSAYGSVDPDGTALTYSWDFGDGTAGATGYALSHVFADAGSYTVTLIASDGLLSRSRTAAVTVGSAPGSSPAARLLHDSVILPVPPVTVGLRRGVASMSVRLRLTVLNADVALPIEVPGHEIQVVADPGSCPLGTISAAPDFSLVTPGIQDRTTVAGGRAAAAYVSLSIQKDAFTSPGGRGLQRCVLTFTAVGPGTDPTPDNNSVAVELNVVDFNDAPDQLVPDTSVASVRPVGIWLARGQAVAQMRVPVVISNIDPQGALLRRTHAVTVTATDGTCPPGTAQGVDLNLAATGVQSSGEVRANGRAIGLLGLSIEANAFATTSALSTARCRIAVEVTDPDDSVPENNLTGVEINVFDRND